MKRSDFVFITGFIILFLPFLLFKDAYDFYREFNSNYGTLMSFIKFAVLATIGESIALRIKNGVYLQKGFGLIPRAIVWGFLGISIKMAFVIFAAGTPLLLEDFGIQGAAASMHGELSWLKALTAFSISVCLNIFYAPVLMTFHKITDTHIVSNGGTVRGLFRPIRFREIFENMNWNVHWNFVLKKTIPIFWIPAQTFNFLLPEEWRILVAAIYGIILGVILAFASLKAK